jgi:hypothetical protein
MTDQIQVALNRIGAEVVRVEKGDTRRVYSIRVKNEPVLAARWKSIVEAFLLGTAEVQTRNEKGRWQADISKWFFPLQGSVRYLWRIMIMAEDAEGIERGENMFSMMALDALREGVEVTSMPLVGRKNYEFDPRTGKTKGAHSMKDSALLIASMVGSGGTG